MVALRRQGDTCRGSFRRSLPRGTAVAGLVYGRVGGPYPLGDEIQILPSSLFLQACIQVEAFYCTEKGEGKRCASED